MTYKYFVQDGNKYQLKSQLVFIGLLSGLFILGGLKFTFFHDEGKEGAMWVGVFMILLGAAAALRLTAKNTIDMDAKQLLVKKNMFAGEVAYNLNDFEGFLVASTVAFFGVTMNATGNMTFNVNGKEKNIMLNQSMFTVKPLNDMINEATSIMQLEK